MKAIVPGLTACLAVMLCLGCDSSSTDPDDGVPNQLGGETALELTQVGQQFDVWLDVDAGLEGSMQDSVMITRSEGGLVTFRTSIRADSAYIASLDSALGTTDLPRAAKLAIVDSYLKKYGATIDTGDWNDARLNFELKLRITSEGIQEYVSSAGDLRKPQTVVRYGASVGDVNRFTDAEGVVVTRTVVQKSVDDDYDIGFWRIKVITVEQRKEDPLIEKITYIANHKFGLVAVGLTTKTGREVRLGIWPPTL
ncbi:MAG TPA: hypothetical protein VNA88_18200 [Candidatus Kapabacteria bacterium]|jgi:hypothetical protein|nr:hypothetical protein [Candidatus Kapabacteria bacterium]